MTEACPVCGEPVEFSEVREDGASIDVDELCATDPDTRWNRVCARASEAGGEPAVETFRHHWESVE